MKTIAIFLAAFSLFLTTNLSLKAEKITTEAPYRHVVIFKFKDSATKKQITAIEKAFSALPGKINTIKGYEWGTNVSPENLNQGFTHCFIVTFKNKADLEAYIPHPEHKAFVKQLMPILDKVLVVDFVAKTQ